MKNKEKFMTNIWVILVGALICCALWGSAFPCIKIGYSMMDIASSDTASQILYAGYRFTLAGILAILIGSITQKKLLLPKRSSFSKIGLLALLQTIIQYLFFYIGLAHTTGVKASIIEGVNVFVAILVGILMGGKIAGFTPASVAMLVYLAMISAVAYSLWGILLKYNPISRVAVFGFMNPVIGVILSAIVLDEKDTLGVTSVIALILVCIGIYIVNRAPKAGTE